MKRLLASLVCWFFFDHRLEVTHTGANKLWDGRWGAGATVRCRRCERVWYL